MKIISNYYGDHKKGCWRRLNRLVHHLANDGHEVTLITSHKPVEIYEPNVKIITLNIKNASYFNFFVYLIFSSLVASLCMICNKGYDRILAFDCHNATPILLGKFFRKTPMMLYIRGVYEHQDFFKTKNYVLKKIFFWINKMGYIYADKVYCVSRKNKEEITRLFGRHYKYIGIIRNNVPNIKKFVSKKPRYKEKSESLVVGYLGQLVNRKNVTFLLELLTYCKEYNIVLHIQGGGPEEENLKESARKLGVDDKVLFMPWSSDISGFFDNIDIFILPSYFDDASNSLLEAMAYNKICFSANTGGSTEILNYDSELLFCPYSGQEELSGILKKILSDEIYKQRFIEKVNQSRIDLTFDWNKKMFNSFLYRKKA